MVEPSGLTSSATRYLRFTGAILKGMQYIVNNPDGNDLRAERSVAGWDVPQRFVISGLFEMPIGRGKRTWAGTSPRWPLR